MLPELSSTQPRRTNKSVRFERGEREEKEGGEREWKREFVCYSVRERECTVCVGERGEGKR